MTKQRHDNARAMAIAGFGLLLLLSSATAQNKPLRLNFESTPLEIVLQNYSEITERTLLLAPKLPTVNITLRSQGPLTREEYIEAIQSVLSMHGIVLIPEGEKFVRVVPGKSAREEPMIIREDGQRGELGESSQLVSQLITLKHIDFSEADKAIKPLLHSARGTVNHFERINSILVTDSEANVVRMLQILKHLDQPVEIREEPNVVRIRFAKASEIKSKLEEIIAESQKEQKKTVTVTRPSPSGPPRVVAQPQARSVPGVIRAPRPARTEAASPETVQEIIEMAERGIIRGNVHIVADDRTNILIIITRPENMRFFERIVEVLDIETSPDFITKVIRLEHADAETVATTLNTLIGSTRKEQTTGAAPARSEPGADDRVARLRDYVEQLQTPGSDVGASKIGELSADNIKILSDKRTNSLLVMASKSDLAAIQGIIQSMDIQLSQVLVEAVIMDVQLDDSIQTGMDWVQQAIAVYQTKDGARQPDFAFAGGGGGGALTPRDVSSLTGSGSISPGSGLTYYLTHFGLNLDVVLNMSASDGRTRVISSPVIVTHDNTEAKIESAMERYFYKGKKWIGTATEGRYEDDVEMRRVGLHLAVTPRINQKRFVVMEISQRIEDIVGTQSIGDTQWPTVQSREMNASIAVQDRETIVLGGLVREKEEKTRRGIPFLYRMPLIGWIFGHRAQDHSRSEIIVFITPYVMDTEADIALESQRRQQTIHTHDLWKKSWSDSRLADDAPDRHRRNQAQPTPSHRTPEAQKIFPPELLEHIRLQEALYEPTARIMERERAAFPSPED